MQSSMRMLPQRGKVCVVCAQTPLRPTSWAAPCHTCISTTALAVMVGCAPLLGSRFLALWHWREAGERMCEEGKQGLGSEDHAASLPCPHKIQTNMHVWAGGGQQQTPIPAAPSALPHQTPAAAEQRSP